MKNVALNSDFPFFLNLGQNVSFLSTYMQQH